MPSRRGFLAALSCLPLVPKWKFASPAQKAFFEEIPPTPSEFVGAYDPDGGSLGITKPDVFNRESPMHAYCTKGAYIKNITVPKGY